MRTAEQNLQLLKEIEANRDFLLAAYEQNPQLLKRAEPRIRELFACLQVLVPQRGVPRQDENDQSEFRQSAAQPGQSQRGISLIELILFIVIISIGLTGILLVMNQVTRHSADPLIHKQAIAAAESLLEEIQLQDFISALGATNAVTLANRSNEYHIVNDYNGFVMTGITDLNGAGLGLAAYNANVAITAEPLGGVAAGSAVRITVTVTDPQGNAIAIDGYRTKY